MSVNLKSRFLVFGTFFGSCLIIGLLVAALTTDYWIESHAKHSKNENAFGHINFGLFYGTKRLNVAYGLRFHRTETKWYINEEVLQYIWWLLTTIGVGIGLVSSFIAGIASVVRAASHTKNKGTMIILFVSNFSSLSAQLVAIIAWVVQFYKSLTKNVLLGEDLQNNWSSDGHSWLSRSFFFVVGGAIVAAINLTLLISALKVERRFRRRTNHDNVDDKLQGAIMLY